MACAMTPIFHYLLWLLVCVSLSSCTDLAAAYFKDILILRNAESVLPNSMSLENVSLALPTPLVFPMALAQDTDTRRLFVAEYKLNNQEKIFSISLDSQLKVKHMAPAVKGGIPSKIEDMSFNPRSKTLYWTDTARSIYKASLPSDHSDVASAYYISKIGTRNKLSGMAFDVCNEHLYWSEASKPSRIMMWGPDDNTQDIVKQGGDEVYQGITFDDTTGKLVWAVTYNTSCRIVTRSDDEMHDQELVNLENCFPFSLTVDEKYVYWADRSRQGIMRASRSNQSDVVMLLKTPPMKTRRAHYDGVYGLIKIHAGSANQTSCQVKKEKSPHVDQLQNSTKSETVTERPGGTVKAKEIYTDPLDPKEIDDDQNTERSDVKSGKVKEHVNEATNPVTIVNPSAEKEEINKDTEVYKYEFVKSSTDKPIESQTDSSSVEPELEPVGTLTIYDNGARQTDMFSSQSTYEVPTTEWSYEDRLKMTIVILAIISFMFLCSTMILAVLLYRRRAVPRKETSVTTRETTQAVTVRGPRQVKRFGPKKSFVSRNKHVLSGSSTCSGLANDGVSINIEDCCQMTLCDTPCYTTVKKQGKPYKDIREKYQILEDKQGLLDNSEEI